jgi:hypothetical protein
MGRIMRKAGGEIQRTKAVLTRYQQKRDGSHERRFRRFEKRKRNATD